MFMKKELSKCAPFIKLVKDYRKRNNYRGGRKSSISIKYYLDKILLVLYLGIPWAALSIFNLKCHFTAVYKKYVKWIKLKFFDTFQINLLKQYRRATIDDFNCSYIDSSDVRNVNGSNKLTNFGMKFKNKRAIRLHSICDKNKITLSVSVTPANRSDVREIENLVNNVYVPINKSYRNPHYIVGDKGYISNETYKELRKKNIILTTPFKKNQKGINSKIKKELLTKRITVEHSYNSLKRSWKRIDRFYERHLDNYLGFIKLANSLMIVDFLNK